MRIEIKNLYAFNGDCFIISIYKDEAVKNIIIDGGISKTYIRSLKNEILKIKENNENIDLLFITHIDDDHIGGIISFFEDDDIKKDIVKRVVFNSAYSMACEFKSHYDSSREINISKIDDTHVSYSQGKTLEKELKKYNLLESTVVSKGDILTLDNLKITILSPDIDELKKLNNKWEIEHDNDQYMSKKDNDYNNSIEELINRDKFKKDSSIVNRNSIAFLLEIGEAKVLMLGDAHPDIIVDSLKSIGYSKKNKLKVDFVKLSHHGSAKNTSPKLLDIIECRKYIISTNGSSHNHPNKLTFARILNKTENITFYFNSPIYEDIFSEKDLKEYKFNCIETEIMELKYDEANCR